MARSPLTRRRPTSEPIASPPPAPDGVGKARKPEGWRDTVEALVGAVLLAAVFRAFVAEAFVIPTGSMAPTLMGRHKEIACPQCAFVYSVGASGEVEGTHGGDVALPRVASGLCQNCRFQADLSREPSYKGDRILVMKFPYEFPGLPASGPPARWDVTVFRFPEEPETNYIKRLVGLPGETLKLWHGDVFLKAPGGSAFEIARKPLPHQRAMMQTVYDDRYRAAALRDDPRWNRWAPVSEGGWTEEGSASGRFRSASGGGWAELRYHHLVPDPGQWLCLTAGEPLPRPPRATLVSDFASYNTGLTAENSDLTGSVGFGQETAWNQPHWVGDLAVSARVENSGGASVRLDLVEGGVVNRCEWDRDGNVTLARGETVLVRRSKAFPTVGKHDVTFANVDNRLTLWVDGVAVFGDGPTYDDSPEAHPSPTTDDLTPARLSALGGEVVVSDLVLERDIYYTVKPGASDLGPAWDERLPRNPQGLFDLLADPARVAALGPFPAGEYRIGEARFLMLGDNSPQSRDSRDWRETDRADPGDPSRGWDPSGRRSWEVPRNLITGKAFCVYWPHGKPFWPGIRLGPDLRVPFRPYFERMKWIR